MYKNSMISLLVITVVVLGTACSNNLQNAEDKISNQQNREIVLNNDNANEERNRLWSEDIAYFAEEFPKRHKNPFSVITEEAFEEKIAEITKSIDKRTNIELFVDINKIIASIGDAHSSIYYWDGYSYPLQYWIFDGKVYIVNADIKYEDMVFSQILKINGVDINEVVGQLTSLISHENESWVLAKLPDYLQSPVYMFGLGIVPDEESAVFTVEKDNEITDFTVHTIQYGKGADFVIKTASNPLIGSFDKYYQYTYLPDSNTIYFEYNVCADMDTQRFSSFNQQMFNEIKAENIDKIIVDLRSNRGGNSEVLNPFTQELESYVSENSDIKIYILIGRNTSSSGMFAIYRIKEAAPNAVSIGEPTGGAMDCYGEVLSFNLPNTQKSIMYSTKYFEFTKYFTYKNAGDKTFLPDIFIEPSMENYINNTDTVLNYALEN